MWNITIMMIALATTALCAAARRGRGRSRRKFNLRKVRINSENAVGALATLDVASAGLTATTADKIRFISLIGSWTWSDLQQITDDAMAFGVAHSDYTAAEIEECLEATGSMDLGDKVAAEKANRLVREIGMFSSVTSAAGSGVQFNDGKPVKTKLNWLMSAGDSLVVWVRNSSSLVYVTGSSINFAGNLWVKD